MQPRRPKIGELAPDGQTVLGNPTRGRGRRATKKGQRVTQVDMDVFMRVRLTQSELAVFATMARFIPDKAGVESRVHLKEVATLTGIAPQNVSRIVSALVERELLFRTETQGVWMLNPHVLYNGSFDEWNDVVDGYPQPMLERA